MRFSTNTLEKMLHNGTNNVDAYSINTSTGALTKLIGSPFAAGTGPDSLSVDISGRYLYVSNKASGNISTLKINSNDCSWHLASAIVVTGILQ